MYHSDGTPLTSDQIFVQLEKIWNSSLQSNKEPVGILTSNHRNSWAKAYSSLIKGTSRAFFDFLTCHTGPVLSWGTQRFHQTLSIWSRYNGPFYR